MVDITSRLGYLIPFLRAGIFLFKDGKILAKMPKNMHHPETKANWITVKVIGFGKALRIDFEDVLVRAELKYQIRQRTCEKY